MDFPYHLWQNEKDHPLIQDAIDLFSTEPLLVTDEIANSIFLNGEAEQLFDDAAESLVNRLAFSLLGFGNRAGAPPSVIKALLGEKESWRGVVDLSQEGAPHRWHFAEISAIKSGDRFICGLVRLSPKPAANPEVS